MGFLLSGSGDFVSVLVAEPLDEVGFLALEGGGGGSREVNQWFSSIFIVHA